MSVQGIFVDGLGSISLEEGGVARIDLLRRSVSERDIEGRPAIEVGGRIVLSFQAFLSFVSTMENLTRTLEESGMLVAADDTEDGERPASRPARSPNFDA